MYILQDFTAVASDINFTQSSTNHNENIYWNVLSSQVPENFT